jgi:hypothetical protein
MAYECENLKIGKCENGIQKKWQADLQGEFKGFEQKHIFPAPLIDPIGKIAKEWHVGNRSHKVNEYLVEKAILKFGS